MIRAGLVSISFRSLDALGIVNLARRCGLGGIEWGGDVHAPHGDLEAARRARVLTHHAGLEVAAYGSYYRAGHSEHNGPCWAQVLGSARTLEAPLIRVWAGARGSGEADERYFRRVVDDLKRVGEMSEIPIALEFHGGTLCDSGQAARQVVEAVDHPRLKMLWQPAVGATFESRLADLRAVKPWLANVHAFQWGPSGDKRPLCEGEGEWREYLRLAQGGADRWALLEFVRGDEPRQLEADAATLRNWLAQE